jgi:hypothetical protein
VAEAHAQLTTIRQYEQLDLADRPGSGISGYNPRMAKVLVSLDDRLLERLDREAAARGLSRSALLAELAAKGLGEPMGPGARPGAHEALRKLDALFCAHGAGIKEDSTAAIRAERDAR